MCYLEPKETKFSQHEIELIDTEVLTLLEKGAIVKSNHSDDQFISNIFVVQKKNGKYRPVLNLKRLNKFIKYFHFKQESLSSVLSGISKNNFFTSIDLTDAYLTVSVKKEDRKYLKFKWKGELYEFTCLVFGLSTAPRVFTKLMKVIFSYIRGIGISSFFYIDDSLLQDPCALKCEENTRVLQKTLKSLGFQINLSKSVIKPVQRITFLGYIIDSVEFKVFLPVEKIEKILKFSRKIFFSKKIKIRDLFCLVGYYASSSCAILLAPIFYRYLDIDKTRALSLNEKNYEAYTELSYKAKQEITWWIENLEKVNGKMISYGSPNLILETDASKVGWGAAVMSENSYTQGRWDKFESLLHINILELKAVKYGLLALCNDKSSIHLCVKSDSATAVNYINNMGGSVESLLKITKEIWIWAATRDIFLSAVHIPGKENIFPDNLSRNFSDSSEWKLHENVFSAISKTFFTPDLDLFATRLNTQLPKFVSWFPDPEAFASDAFSICWTDLYLPYIFSPFSVIQRVLQKITEEKVRKVLMVVPWWKTQSWFPLLLNCLIDFPRKLPMRRDLLRLSHNGQLHSMNKRKLFLVACVVSGDPYLIKDFQNSLRTLSLNHGDPPQQSNIITNGRNGEYGVLKGKLIPFLPLKQNL